MVKLNFNKPIYLLFLMGLILISCSGQVKTTTNKEPNTALSIPTVVKKNKAVALAPDFDTTLVSQYIRSIFQDSKGNMWFGTINDGVVRYDGKTLTYFADADVFINSTVYAIN